MVAWLGCWLLKAAGAVIPLYCAAYFGDSKIILFPMAGPEVPVPLPEGLPYDFHLIEFSADGQAIYGQRLYGWDGITKIEFKPTRQSMVPGTRGIGTIGSLVVLRPSGRILVSGSAKIGDAVECGVFEIDAGSETFRPLFIGRFPDCGGDISPDGKYVLNSSRAEGNLLTVRDLDTGAVRPVGRNMTGATWSPDGRWIAAIRHVSGSSDVILIDAANISRRKNLGGTSDTQAMWSPDSKNLLLSKLQEIRCGWFLASLEVIDAQTGKRRGIKSSHCKINVNAIGWMDPGAVR